MSLKLTFLGTAGSIISATRGYPAFLINDDLLLDCGEGTTQKLIQLDSIDTIKTICLTHRHLDHFIGIGALLWHFGLAKRKEPLEIIGSPGIEHTINTILDLAHTPDKLKPFKITYKELEDTEDVQIIGGKYNLSSIQADHSIISFSYRVEFEGKSICYIGDTKPNPRLLKLVKNCNLIISEATLPDNLKKHAHDIGHSTPSDAAQIATEAGCDTLALVHISSYFQNQIDDFKKEAEAVFSKEVIIPEDLMEIIL